MSYLYDSNGKVIGSLSNNGETNASISTFKKIGIIGDSFASGTVNVNGEQPSYPELSWGQVIGREQGVSVTNFTTAGLNTRTWLTHSNGLTKLLNTEQQGLYILALGINDDNLGESYIGTIADINDDYTLNADTFYGNYGKIIAQIKEYAPNAKLVMTTLARQEPLKEQIDSAIIELADHFTIQYIILEDDDYFNTGEFPMSNGHPSVIAHGGMAKAITRLIESNMLNNPSYYIDYADDTEEGNNDADTYSKIEIDSKLTDYPKKDEVIPTPATANIGQTIVVKEIDENGKPTKWEATDIGGGTSTSKEWELVASYVHSGNRKIQPTALDKTTGYFTCENHGLVTGDYIIPSYKVEDQVYCPIPFELLLKANYLNDTLYPIRNAVTVIDDNTFMITGKTSYAETNNTYVDVTKFYFETQNEDFSGFNNLNIDLNTHDLKIIAHDFGKRVNIQLNYKGNIYRWLAMNNGHEFGLCQGIPITSLGGVESYGSVILFFKNGILYGKSQQSMYPIVLKSNTLEYSRTPRNHQYYCPVLKEGNNLTALNKIAFNTYYDKDIKPKNGGWIEIWKRKK